jgi:hypothetical protein
VLFTGPEGTVRYIAVVAMVTAILKVFVEVAG